MTEIPRPAEGTSEGLPTFRAAAVALVVTLAILALAALFKIDISAARDFRTDAVVRSAFSPHEMIRPRFQDQSPFTIWLPSDWFVWDSVRAGRLPLWERLQGGGYSPVINLYGGVFHPARWLAALFPREAMPSIVIMIALSAGGFGWYWFARANGYSALASVLGATLFAVSSPSMSYVHFSGSILPLAHLPWIVLLLQVAVRTKSRKVFALETILIALLLISGHPLIILSVVLAAVSFATAHCFVRRSPAPLLMLGVAGGLAVLLAAFALLPAVLAVPNQWTYKTTTPEGRAYVPYDFDRWLDALDDIVDDAFTTTGYIDSPQFFTFIGLGAALLIVTAACSTWRSNRYRTIVALTILWFSVVVPGPWMWPLRTLAPFGYLKPWYYCCAFAFFMPAAVVAGFELLWRQMRMARFLAALLIVSALGAHAERAYGIFHPVRWGPIVRGPLVDRLRDGTRTTGLWGQVNLPNTSRLTSIEDVRQSNPSFSRRAHVWWQLVDSDIESRSYPTTRVTDHLTSPLVGDFNVRYVIQDRLPAAGTSSTSLYDRIDSRLSPNIAAFALAFLTPSAEVRRIPGLVRPRAHFARGVIAVPTIGDAEALLRRDPSVVHRFAVVEGDPGPELPVSSRGDVRVIYPADARVTLLTDSPTGGLVVLHDSFAAGWTAMISGRQVPVHPVNIMSRGVVVPAGRQRVEMSYCPPGLPAGTVISIGTFVTLMVLALVRRSSRRVHSDSARIGGPSANR